MQSLFLIPQQMVLGEKLAFLLLGTLSDIIEVDATDYMMLLGVG